MTRQSIPEEHKSSRALGIIDLKDLGWLTVCFSEKKQKKKVISEPKWRPGRGSARREGRIHPERSSGRRRDVPGWQRPPSSSLSSVAAAAAAAPGPASPGGRSRLTHGHGERGGRGLNPPSSFPGDSHSLRSQVLPKQEADAPPRVSIDNYVATHGRVSAEWPGRRRQSVSPRARGRGPGGGGNPRSRAFNSLAAAASAPGGARVGRETNPQRPNTPPTARRGSGRGRLRAAAALGAHRLPPASPSSCLCLPDSRLALPSSASRTPGETDFGSSPEEAGFSLCSGGGPPGMVSSQSFESPLSSSTLQSRAPQPPPVIAPQANMAAAAAAAA